MWNYEKRLEYPVNITRCNPKAAMVIMSQYGGLYTTTCRLYLKPYIISSYFPETHHVLHGA